MLVEQNELRIDVSLDRKFAQQAGTKTVNRSYDRTFQRALVTQPRLAFTAR